MPEHMRDVQARLLPQPSDGKVGSADAAPSLAALLYRAADDYHNLAVLGVPESIIKSLPGLRPWSIPAEIMDFAAGKLPYLVIPFCRHALRALPELHEESSCFAYDAADVLHDGTSKVEYRCARSAAVHNVKRKGKAAGGGSGEVASADSGDERSADEGSAIADDVSDNGELLANDADVDRARGDCASLAGKRDLLEEEPQSSSSDPKAPPKLLRQQFSHSFAAAAGVAAPGLRSACAPLIATPTQPYAQDCSARLFAYVPPLALPGASMLLVRRCNSDAGGAVIKHCHRLDEHLPLADVLEQAIVLGIKQTGAFTKGSAECQNWLEQVLPRICALTRIAVACTYSFTCLCNALSLAAQHYREYAGASFSSWSAPKFKSLCGTADAPSPAGLGRQRFGHHAPHECVMRRRNKWCG